jgi:putative ABC transport system substrate-binding protein
MMIRRALVGFTGVVLVVVVVACAFSEASAQKREPMPRVGILTPVASAAAKPLWDAFREAMKELGYVEGKSVVYEYRSAEGQLDRLPQLWPS